MTHLFHKYFSVAFTFSLVVTSSISGATVPEDHFVLGPLAPISADGGAIVGKKLANGVHAWLGIPFAEPPIHDLRWKPPQPVKPWQGVYNADRLAPECIQSLRPRLNNQYYGVMGTSEDCLYLNIWAPADAKLGKNLPVILWIYGGGFTIGSASIPLYDGAAIAQRGAIFVNFNYRVGILGYMAHPELTAESPQHASGNYGGLDQIAALQWVRRNISKFGGDPSRVTIMGQSAGGIAVSTLQNSPLAKGLFAGGVALSGTQWQDGGKAQMGLAAAEQIGIKVQSSLNLASLADLRAVPADRLLGLQEDCQLGCSGGKIPTVGPIVDGYFQKAPPLATFTAHQQNDVPLIVGYTNDEGRNAVSNALTTEEYRSAAAQGYSANAAEFLSLYPAVTDAQAVAAGHEAARDAGVANAARNWAIAQSTYGTAPVFIEDMAYVQPFNPAVVIADHPERIGAYHNSETPYFLGTYEALTMFRPTRLWSDRDRKLSDAMMDSLIAFATTGNPATPTVAWPAWNAKTEKIIHFDIPIRTVGMNRKRMEFHRLHPLQGATIVLPKGTRD